MARNAITLGIAVSLSGRYATLGRQVLAGLECYVHHVNATGGIRPVAGDRPLPVTLRVEDDESTASCVRTRVEKLIRDDVVDLLLGPYGSGLTFAAAETAEAAEFVLWNHSGSADQIFESRFKWTVGIISPASQYLCVVLELLRSLDAEAKRVALFNADTGFATDMSMGVLRWLKKRNYSLTTHQRYPSGREDFRDLIDGLNANPPDWLLGVGRVEDDLRLARQLCDQHPRLKAVGLVVAAIEQFKEEMGERAAGFLAPSQWEPQVRYPVDCGPRTDVFVNAYRQQSSVPLDYPAAQGYIGGVIAQRCVEAAGSLEQRALREAAQRLQCTTFYGPFGIDPSTGGQTAHHMLVTQWQQGGKKVVWPPQVADAAPIYPGRFWK